MRWAFRVGKRDGIEQILEQHDIQSLAQRRDYHDRTFLNRVEAGCYSIDLKDYINFNPSYGTRCGTIKPHFRIDQFKYSYYNRMSNSVKCFKFAGK